MFSLYINLQFDKISKLHSLIELFIDLAWRNGFLYLWVLKWQISPRKFLIHRFLLAGVYCNTRNCKDGGGVNTSHP